MEDLLAAAQAAYNAVATALAGMRGLVAFGAVVVVGVAAVALTARLGWAWRQAARNRRWIR